MIYFTSYDSEGRFLLQFDALDLAEVAANVPPGGGMLAGLHDFDKVYFDKRRGVVTPYPARPGPWAEFDFAAGAWVDPRPIEILFDEADAEFEAWRSRQSLPRADFCLALVDAGLLPVDEAIEAAKGTWPAAWSAMLSGLAPRPAAALQIQWAAAGTIERNSALLDRVAAFLVLSPEQVDALFAPAK